MAKQVVRTISEESTVDTVNTQETNKEVTQYAVLYQFIYLISGIIQGLLGLRLLFQVAGANPAAGFVQFLYGITDVFMAPFRLIFPTSVAAGSVVEWSVLVAILIYSLLTWLFVKVLQIMFTADTGA